MENKNWYHFFRMNFGNISKKMHTLQPEISLLVIYVKETYARMEGDMHNICKSKDLEKG